MKYDFLVSLNFLVPVNCLASLYSQVLLHRLTSRNDIEVAAVNSEI